MIPYYSANSKNFSVVPKVLVSFQILIFSHMHMHIYKCCFRRQVTSVVSDSVQPHRQQPTRRPRPWDSPGKNTGVGCHFLLQCRKVKSESEVAQSCVTLSDPMDCSLPGSSVHGTFQARVLEPPARLLYPWDTSGRNTGVGCCALLQGIFLTEG